MEPTLIWCDYNAEQDELEKKFGDNNPGPNIVWGENGKREDSPKSSPKGRTFVR